MVGHITIPSHLPRPLAVAGLPFGASARDALAAFSAGANAH